MGRSSESGEDDDVDEEAEDDTDDAESHDDDVESLIDEVAGDDGFGSHSDDDDCRRDDEAEDEEEEEEEESDEHTEDSAAALKSLFAQDTGLVSAFLVGQSAEAEQRWQGWKRTLDAELLSAGGQLPWTSLCEVVAKRYKTSHPQCRANDELLANKALANIPSSYLSKKDAVACLEFRLENKDPHLSKSVTFAPEKIESCAGIYPHPFPTAREHLDGLAKLSEVLHESSGFLHDGTLIVTCKMQVGLPIDARVCNKSPKALGESDLGVQLQELLDKGRHADVQVRVQGELTNVHSLILSARSPVFDAMWSHSMREKEEKLVTIDESDPAAVRAMIKFMYTDTLDITLGNDDITIEILKVAHKYQVEKLVEHCVEALSSALTGEFAVKNLILADLLGHNPLKSKCMEFITSSSDRLSEIQDLESFKDLANTRPHLLTELFAAVFPTAKRRKRD